MSKTCPCCGFVYTLATWKSLPLRGIQRWGDIEPPHEVRQCPCGSTIHVLLSLVRGSHDDQCGGPQSSQAGCR